jgi:hypothetical protein
MSKKSSRTKKQHKSKPANTQIGQKPGVELELVVQRLQTMMGPNATAESGEITDRLGVVRQFDVIIRGTLGGWPAFGVIECKDHSRKKDVAEIDKFAANCDHIDLLPDTWAVDIASVRLIRLDP